MKLSVFVAAAAALFMNEAETARRVGFFEPAGIVSAYADRVDFATISYRSPEHLRTNLKLAQSYGLRVNIDIGASLVHNADPATLKRSFTNSAGKIVVKAFPPLKTNKILRLNEVAARRRAMADVLDVAKDFTDVVDVIFLIDEPYINGVSKTELETLAAEVRQGMAERRLSFRVGVNFAGANFNSSFAAMIASAAQAYVERADAYNALPAPDVVAWRPTFARHRLSTYDSAGNMFTEGGIPGGVDVVAFDFYTATFLSDTLYDKALIWLAESGREPACKKFGKITVSSFRSSLSFFGGSLRENEDEVLDDLYDCRTGTTVRLLREEISKSTSPNADIMLITQSSRNGFYEHASNGDEKQTGDITKVNARSMAEVRRALRFYAQRADEIRAGIAFFTYSDAVDKSISISVEGAENLPGALELISSASGRSPGNAYR
ncbi:hypothetical protein [Hyphomicrobium sp. DY-1]|uniref:hypothetical protein n=1 Tax=Hyphomicrobium sp. DY-1 TaxID=3075650 RepID=UPI0039C004D2